MKEPKTSRSAFLPSSGTEEKENRRKHNDMRENENNLWAKAAKEEEKVFVIVEWLDDD